MKSFPLKTIVSVVGGNVLQGTQDLVVRGVVTRLRKLGPGKLLIDLHGDRNGELGILPTNPFCAIMTDRPARFQGLDARTPLVQVEQSEAAYWKWVDYYRNLLQIPVIGVTGTCGKTTTKEMIRHILAGSRRVTATYKSYNALFRNLGYLQDMDDCTQAAVFEMGIAYPGDILISSRYFKPQVGVITNIGVDHLQGAGNLETYIKAKSEMLEGLGYRGTLVLNADDATSQKIDLTPFQGKVVYFGVRRNCHYRALDITQAGGILKFGLYCDGRTYPFSVPGRGEFTIYNALAAIAATHAVGVEFEEAQARLASFQNVEKHFEFKAGLAGSTVIDDTWSTNPTSALAAVQMLQALAGGKKTIAVLGKMSLLGKYRDQYHFELGEKVAALGLNGLITLGDGAVQIGLGALHYGMDSQKVYFCQDPEAAVRLLQKLLDQNTVALVKTSMLTSYRGLMERIILPKE